MEADLETMWQVTTADNERFRETLQRSLRKYEAPDGGDMDLNELLCDSDQEHWCVWSLRGGQKLKTIFVRRSRMDFIQNRNF